MAHAYCYEYPRPAVTVDVVVFTVREGTLRTLLIRRKKDPFAGRWAIPGGFLEIDEPVERGARRELREETGVEVPWPLDPIGFFGAVDRDPRARTISLAHATVVRSPGPEPLGADDASEAAWIDVAQVGPLAFDHDQILASALTWLTLSIEAGPVGLALLPEPFQATDVQDLFRAVHGTPAGAATWHRNLRRAGALVAVGGRPARYRAVDPALHLIPKPSGPPSSRGDRGA
jgi:8-oxo-dGTP diphosphatase